MYNCRSKERKLPSRRNKFHSPNWCLGFGGVGVHTRSLHPKHHRPLWLNCGKTSVPIVSWAEVFSNLAPSANDTSRFITSVRFHFGFLMPTPKQLEVSASSWGDLPPPTSSFLLIPTHLAFKPQPRIIICAPHFRPGNFFSLYVRLAQHSLCNHTYLICMDVFTCISWPSHSSSSRTHL